LMFLLLYPPERNLGYRLNRGLTELRGGRELLGKGEYNFLVAN
jgi:hypothetical protein